MRRKKNVKKGIQFCLMVCGASGTGVYSNTAPECVVSIGLITTLLRPHDFREHPLRQASSGGQGRRRCRQCPSGRRRSHQASYCWCVDCFFPPYIDPSTNTNQSRITELELDDEGTRISLTIVDTPGFGDQIDNEARHVTRNPSMRPLPR